LAERLADEVAAIGRAELAPAVLERATELLRDYLGVALGGAGEESSVVLRRGLGALGGGGKATVLGAAERLSAPHAALANGRAAPRRRARDRGQPGRRLDGVPRERRVDQAAPSRLGRARGPPRRDPRRRRIPRADHDPRGPLRVPARLLGWCRPGRARGKRQL